MAKSEIFIGLTPVSIANFGINNIKNEFKELNFNLNNINFNLIYAKKVRLTSVPWVSV